MSTPEADARRAALRLGAEAEAAVASLLEDQGWQVLARNWRGGGGELDLVVGRRGALRFVEVKARAPDDPVGGLEAVDTGKQRRLRLAARAFLAGYDDLVDEACFLVALVEGGQIELVDDAFDG